MAALYMVLTPRWAPSPYKLYIKSDADLLLKLAPERLDERTSSAGAMMPEKCETSCWYLLVTLATAPAGRCSSYSLREGIPLPSHESVLRLSLASHSYSRTQAFCGSFQSAPTLLTVSVLCTQLPQPPGSLKAAGNSSLKQVLGLALAQLRQAIGISILHTVLPGTGAAVLASANALWLIQSARSKSRSFLRLSLGLPDKHAASKLVLLHQTMAVFSHLLNIQEGIEHERTVTQDTCSNELRIQDTHQSK